MPGKAEVLKKAASHKICPHCDSPLDEKDLTCPECGKLYWQTDSPPHAEMAERETEEGTMGCLPLFFWPLLISFAITSILILLGFIVHVFSHFEANQVKVIWILFSTATGGFVYLIIVKIKKRKL
jgi:hypothetical protein